MVGGWFHVSSDSCSQLPASDAGHMTLISVLGPAWGAHLAQWRSSPEVSGLGRLLFLCVQGRL